MFLRSSTGPMVSHEPRTSAGEPRANLGRLDASHEATRLQVVAPRARVGPGLPPGQASPVLDSPSPIAARPRWGGGVRRAARAAIRRPGTNAPVGRAAQEPGRRCEHVGSARVIDTAPERVA